MSWQTIVKENDLAISEITLKQAFKFGRLDAEYYQPEYLQVESLLANKEHFFFQKKEVVSGPFGSTLKSDEYLKEGVYLVRVQDIKQRFFLDTEEMVCISEDSNKKIKNSELQVGDFVVSKVGNTIGLIARVDEQMKKANVSENNIGIKLGKYSEGTKYATLAFLNSKYGQNQILRRISGNAQPKLNVFNLNEVIIPIFPLNLQTEIEKIIKSAYQKQFNSKQLYREAEQFFLKEIDLEGYRETGEAISVRNFSEALTDNRFDAEYWQPKYDEITKRVSKVPQEKLGNIVSVKKGVEVGSEAYAEEGKDFIRVSDFTVYGIEDVEKKISEELYDGLKENYKPKKGEVLFTKDGTIGISFALNEDIDAIVSGAFLRLKPKIKINNNYLALVLNSFYCKAQIERMSGGAIIAHLKPESAMQIKVPMLSENKQEELAGKVLEALRLRKEAKELLEKAKRAVEIFVEKDEQEALSYLGRF